MRRKVYSLGAVAAVAALALAGCSAGGSGQSGQSGQSGDEGSAAADLAAVPASDVNKKDRSELEKGGELRFGITAVPTYWNPAHINGNGVELNNMVGYTSVVNWVYNEDATFEPNKNYVESYEYKTGEDASNGKQEVVLHLNPKAKWNDGNPINWEDYYATWQACGTAAENADEFLCAARDGLDHWENVEKGEGDFDVVISFTDVFPDWSAALSTVYPKAGFADVATFNEAWSEPNNDWQAGPYKFEGVDVAQKTVTLVPNELWWGEEPLLDKLSFREMTADAMGTGFANGEIDVLDGIINAQQYLQAETRADAEIRRSQGKQWRHFTFNGESGVLQDAGVRVALARGIDRAAITESDLAGIPDLDPQALVKENHFFQPGQEGYEPVGEAFGYDPEKAAEELDELGWTLADGAEYRTNEAGETLEFEYAMMPDVPTSKNEGELMQAQLKEIGVKVNIRNVDGATFFDETVIPGAFGVTTFTWQGTPYPMANITQLYGCGDNLAPSGSNFTRVCVPEIEELAKQIATNPDKAERIRLTNEVDKLIWENGMILPIYSRMEMTAVPSNLANYGAFGMSTTKPEDVGFTK